METYVNCDTLIENEVSKILKLTLTCPICNNIYINPVMCMKCQKTYCKKCIDDSDNQDRKCSCDNPNYQISIDKNYLLSQLKFICVGCGIEIQYNEAQKHHDSCCPDMTSKSMNFNNISRKPKIKRLKIEEMSNFQRKGDNITYITGN